MNFKHRPVVLLILDGYGLSDNPLHNAVAEANTPVMDRLEKEYPFVKDMRADFLSVFRTDRWATPRSAI